MLIKQITRKPKQSGTDSEISEIHQCLIELTKDWWTFSFDFESLTGKGVVETLTTAEKVIKVFGQENYNIIENLNKTSLEDWRR